MNVVSRPADPAGIRCWIVTRCRTVALDGRLWRGVALLAGACGLWLLGCTGLRFASAGLSHRVKVALLVVALLAIFSRYFA